MKKDPMAILEDGVSANKVEAALATIGIALRNSEGEFRALQDVMDELGMKWNSLTRNQQAYIATVAAGSRQQSRFLALMNNYDRTLDLIAESQNSAGAAAQQYAIYQDSVAAAQARLTASWEKFYSKIVDNDLIKTAINGLSSLVEVLSKIPPVITTIGASLGALELQNIFKSIRSNGNNVANLAKNFKDLYEFSKNNVGSFSELVKISPKISGGFKILGNNLHGVGSSIIGITKATSAFVAANAWWFIGGLAVAGIIAGITHALTAQKRAYEENINKIKQYQEESNNLTTKINNIENLLNSYEMLASKVNRTTEEQTELNNVIEQISDIYPEAIEWIDDYGNKHLENVKTLKEEIELEKQLLKDNQRAALQQRETLLNKPSKEWKQEDFIAIGFNSVDVNRYFNAREDLDYYNNLGAFSLNRIPEGIEDLGNLIEQNIITKEEAATEGINRINELIDEYNLKMTKLGENSSWESVLFSSNKIKEFRDGLSNTIKDTENLINQLIDDMRRTNLIDLSFLNLEYSDQQGTEAAQKIIASKFKTFISSLSNDAYEIFINSIGGENQLTEVVQKAIDNIDIENSIKIKELTDKITEGIITPEEMNEFYELLGLTAGEGFAEGLKESLDKKKEEIRKNIIEAAEVKFGKDGEVNFNNLSNETLTTMTQMPTQDYGLNAAQALMFAPAWEDFQKKLSNASKEGNFEGIKDSIYLFDSDQELAESYKEKWRKMTRDAIDDSINGMSDQISQELEEAINTLSSVLGKDYSSIDISGALEYSNLFGSDFLDHITSDGNGKLILDNYGKMVVYEHELAESRQQVNDKLEKLNTQYDLLEDKESKEAKNLKEEINTWEKIIPKISEVNKEFEGLINLTEEINQNTKTYNKNLEELGESAQNNADALKFSSDIAADYEGIVNTTKELEKQMQNIGNVSRETMDQLTAYGPAFQDFFTIDDNQIYFNLNNIVGEYASAAEAVIDIARKQQKAQIEAKTIEMDNEIEYARARARGYENLANLLDEYVHEVILNEHNMSDDERGQLQTRIKNEVSTHQTALNNAEETYNKQKEMALKLYDQLAQLDSTYWANIGKDNIQGAIKDIYNGLGSIHEAAQLEASDLIESGDPSKILEAANNYRSAAKGLKAYADSLETAKERLRVIDPTIYNDLAEKMEAAGKSGSEGMDKLADLTLKAAEAIEDLDKLVKELNADLADINLDYNFFSDLFQAWEKEWDYYYNIKRLISELGQQGQYIDNIISADYTTADSKVAGYHAKIGNLISQMAANDTYITSLRTGMSQTAIELMKEYGEYYKINPDTGQIYQTDKSLNEINTTINAAKQELYELSKVQNQRQNDLNLENSKLEALEQEKSAYESILSEVESQIDSYKNLDNVIADTSELEDTRSAIKAKIEISDESIEAQKEKIRKMEDEIQELEIQISLKDNIESDLEDYVAKMEEKVQEYEEYWDTLNSTILEQQEILSQLNDVYSYYVDTAISTQQELYNAIVENYQKEIDQKKEQYDYLKQLDKDYLDSVKNSISQERQAREDVNRQKSYQQSLQRMQLLQQDTSGAYRNEISQLEKEIESQRQDLYDDLVDKQVEALEKEIEKRHELYDKEVAALEERLAYMQENAILLWEMVNTIIAEGTESMMAELETMTDYINSNELSRQKQRKQWEQNIKIAYDGVVNNQISNINTMVEKGNDYVNSLKEIKSSIETNIETYKNSTEILIENNENFQNAMDAFMTEWNRITNAFTGYYESWEQTVSALKIGLDNNLQALIDMNNEGGSIRELDDSLRENAKKLYDDFIEERQRYRDELNSLIQKIRDEISSAISSAASAIRNAAGGTSTSPSNSSVTSGTGGTSGYASSNNTSSSSSITGNSEEIKYNGWQVQYTLNGQPKTYTQRVQGGATWDQIYAMYEAFIRLIRKSDPAATFWGLKHLKTGGLVDFTGPAWLDGTSSNPERVLSPHQTKLFESMVNSLEKSTNSNINSSLGSSYNIGDIITNVQVDKLDNETDINKLVKQVEDKIIKTIRNRVVVSV